MHLSHIAFLFKFITFELSTIFLFIFSSTFNNESRWCHFTCKLQHHFKPFVTFLQIANSPGVQRWCWQRSSKWQGDRKFYLHELALSCHISYENAKASMILNTLKISLFKKKIKKKLILPGGQHQPWLPPTPDIAGSCLTISPTPQWARINLALNPAATVSITATWLHPPMDWQHCAHDDILGHKTSLHKFKKIIITQESFYDTKYKTRSQLQEKKAQKLINTCMLNNMH